MKRKIIYPTVVLLLIVYILLAVFQLLYVLCPRVELPLTQAAAERIGGKILHVSYPQLFNNQKIRGRKLDVSVKAVDFGDVWEVYIHSDAHIVEIDGGRHMLRGYLSRYVILDKASGDMLYFGRYDKRYK